MVKAILWGGADKINEWKGLYYPPVHVRFIENKLVVTDYYNIELQDEVGLKIGDIITIINGKSITQILKETQRVGIVPDIEIKPTIEGIRSEKDELIDKAIEMILKE